MARGARLASLAVRLALPAGLCLTAAAPAVAETPSLKIANSQLEPLNWGDLTGWPEDDHVAAFKTFMDSCKAILPRTPVPGRDAGPMLHALQHVCRRARDYMASDNDKARGFFETNFRPVRIATLGEAAGFLTGYYEPIIDGSPIWTQEFYVPVYGKPSNLIAGARRRVAEGFPNKGPVGRKFGRKKIVPYYDRGEIEDGVLSGRGLEICYLKDPIDLLFIQIQGSARVRMPDGSIKRINYAAHNGYPYTPVGRPLIEMGAIPREEMSMARIRKWMEENPEPAAEVRRKNRSYVFFREVPLSATEEPKGAQGVALTPGRSIAVDKALHIYGTPFFIEADLPIDNGSSTNKFRRLMVGQDTGSAIVGPARADLYFGAGHEAGQIAGRIRHPGRFAMLVPRGLDLAAVRDVPLPPPRPEFMLNHSKTTPLPRPRPRIGTEASR